jgi:hypothetical protein
MIASLSTGQIHLANSGGTAALGAAAGGLDLKVIGTFTSRIPFDLAIVKFLERRFKVSSRCS